MYKRRSYRAGWLRSERIPLAVYAALLILVCASGISRGAPPGMDPVRASAEVRIGRALDLAALTCVILDAASGDTIAARCSVTDCNGVSRHPPLAESIYHYLNPGYFYSDGLFTIPVPAGQTTVRLSRGPEYGTVELTAQILADTTLSIAVPRMLDMAALGWYCADTHVHLCHAGGAYELDPEDALLMGRAEGLNLVVCLDNEYYFTGGPDPCSTTDCIVYMSEERRTGAYGDLALLGLTSLIYPFSSEWSPIAGAAADAAHIQNGACVIAAHPVTTDDFRDIEGWPGVGMARELPVDMTKGRIDCIEIMSYSNCHGGGIELELWYRLLNCGFSASACSGTDACMNRPEEYPLGVFRTYAHLPSGDLESGAILNAIAAGRSFVTTGPLITAFTVDGRTMGETVHLGKGSKSVHCTLSIRSVSPLERAEIVMNGEVIRRFHIGGTTGDLDASFETAVDRSGWIAARVCGANTSWLAVRDSTFAHTNPVYLSVAGGRFVEPVDAVYFIEWIRDLETLARGEGEWASPIDSVRAFDEFSAARLYYQMLPEMTTAIGEGGVFPVAKLYLGTNAPNPFSGSTTIHYGINDAALFGGAGEGYPGSAEIAIYDVRGRLVRTLLGGGIAGGLNAVAWDGTDDRGRRVASGVYFYRVRVGAGWGGGKMLIVR